MAESSRIPGGSEPFRTAEKDVAINYRYMDKIILVLVLAFISSSGRDDLLSPDLRCPERETLESSL